MIAQSEKYPCVDLAAAAAGLTPEGSKKIQFTITTETDEGSHVGEPKSASRYLETEGLETYKSISQEEEYEESKSRIPQIRIQPA